MSLIQKVEKIKKKKTPQLQNFTKTVVKREKKRYTWEASVEIKTSFMSMRSHLF